MENLHNKILESNNWYRSWHEKDSHAIVHWLLLILVAVFAWSSINGQIYLWLNQIDQQEVMVNVPNTKATLSLTPQTNSVKLGDTFSVDIILDTKAGAIDGVDIYGLHYDPTILKVIDDLPNQRGVQILPGKIIPNSAVNIVEESTGTIKLGQLSAGGENFTGRGVLATIHFKAVGLGSSYLKFDFNRGSTIDTNVAHRGKDKLSSVVDAIYTVVAK